MREIKSVNRRITIGSSLFFLTTATGIDVVPSQRTAACSRNLYPEKAAIFLHSMSKSHLALAACDNNRSAPALPELVERMSSAVSCPSDASISAFATACWSLRPFAFALAVFINFF